MYVLSVQSSSSASTVAQSISKTGFTASVSTEANSSRRRTISVHLNNQLRLENVLALLVLLARFVSLFVLPAHNTAALLACNVSHVMAPGGHVAVGNFLFFDVDDGVEQVGFAVLTAEIAADDVLMVAEMGFAVGAPIDLAGIEVDVVRETHSVGVLVLFMSICYADGPGAGKGGGKVL